MNRYHIELEGTTPLLMHSDNLGFKEKISAWQKDPANKANSVAGDDRSPAWTWIGCLYHDGRNVGMASDNLMTMLREGGAKVLTGKGKETYKKQTQSGIMLDAQQFDLFVQGERIAIDDVNVLKYEPDFKDHLELAEALGFELNVKRAKIGRSKHVRVRPMFRNWVLSGTLTVIDTEMTGLTQKTLETILTYAGALCGLGDWRPSSPSSGSFGKFLPAIKKIS